MSELKTGIVRFTGALTRVCSHCQLVDEADEKTEDSSIRKAAGHRGDDESSVWARGRQRRGRNADWL